MRIIFRYDDFSAGAAVSLETDRMVFDLFLQYRLALLVGVTPRMSGAIHNLKNEVFHHLERDADRIALLRKGLEQGWQLALHGFNHQSTGSVQASEFAGQPREVQAAKIEEGLQILRPCFPGAALDVFIPPWDSFDGTTADCLADQGFRVICGTYTTRGFGHPKVSFVPSLFETRGLVDYLTHYSVEDLKRVAGDGWLVVTLHGYNFDGSRKGCFVSIPALSETLKKLQDSGVSVGVIPTGEKPSLLNARQESILKGKLLLMPAKTGQRVSPIQRPARERACPQANRRWSRAPGLEAENAIQTRLLRQDSWREESASSPCRWYANYAARRRASGASLRVALGSNNSTSGDSRTAVGTGWCCTHKFC